MLWGFLCNFPGWSVEKKVIKEGTWTKDVFLESEGINNRTKSKCFWRKLTPLLILLLQEFITEYFFPTGEAVLCHLGHETVRGDLEEAEISV